MRLIRINITGLVNVLETLQLKRILFHSGVFSVLAGIWSMAIEQPPNPFFTKVALHIFTAAIILLPLLTIILIRKSFISRLVYFLVLFANSVSFLIAFVAFTLFWMSAENNFGVILILLVLLYLLTALKHAYRLFFSLVSIRRRCKVKHEMYFSRRLWSGSLIKYEKEKAGHTRRNENLKTFPPGRTYRLVLSIFVFALGAVFTFLTVVNAYDPGLAYYVFNLEFSAAWGIIRSFPDRSYDPRAYQLWFEILSTLIIIFPAGVCFFIFGFFQNQRRREAVPVSELPLSEDMRQGDILLLRSFKDDVKQVAKQLNPFLLPFKLYPWDSTLEQVIVNRFEKFGNIHLLDIEEENWKLLKNRIVKSLTFLLGEKRVIKFLKLYFPAIWYKLPPIGGIRHYFTNAAEEEWQAEIERAMPLARMQLVILGETENLLWEMKKIDELGLSEKTVFLMPPLIRKKNFEARWNEFIAYVGAMKNYDTELLGKINPRRVLAICLREDKFICITGKALSDRFYSSTFDITSIVMLSDKPVFNSFIAPYAEDAIQTLPDQNAGSS